MVTVDLLFHLFPTVSPLPHGPKSTRFNKIYIPERKSYLSEGNFIPSWINTIGNLLFDTMDEYTLQFTVITNIISSDPSPRIVVTFILVPVH